MKVTIIYGSMGGVTEDIASRVGDIFKAEVVNIYDIKKGQRFEETDFFIFAASTWGDGELCDDWGSGIDKIDEFSLQDKYVAFIGLGDQYGYDDTFCDGIGILYEKVKERGIKHVGKWDTQGYEYEGSAAESEGKFVGLVLDEDNQDSLTEGRISQWVEQLKTEVEGL